MDGRSLASKAGLQCLISATPPLPPPSHFSQVLEETGIRTRFSCVLAVRQAHGFAFGNSDLFLVRPGRLGREGGNGRGMRDWWMTTHVHSL